MIFEVKFMSRLEIKVVFKIRQNCSLKSRLKSTLIFEVKFMSRLEIKVVFKMRQDCSLKSRLKSTLIFEVKFMSRHEIKVVFKMRQDSLFITTVVSLVFNHRGKNVLGLLLKDWIFPQLPDGLSVQHFVIWRNLKNFITCQTFRIQLLVLLYCKRRKQSCFPAILLTSSFLTRILNENSIIQQC